jgi:hypothetical protein
MEKELLPVHITRNLNDKAILSFFFFFIHVLAL